MVLERKETTIVYRCPECGAAVFSMVGIFSLTADMIRMKCPCGKSELEIVYTKDKKIRLNVPCFLCPKPHSYMISSQMFFEKELFSFACSYSGVDICFIGKNDNVQNAMKESERELIEMLGDVDIDALKNSRNSNIELSDPQVFDIVMYVVHELADEGRIKCKCEDDGDYEVEIYDDYLKIICRKCGASLDIKTNSLTAANDFLGTEELVLK